MLRVQHLATVNCVKSTLGLLHGQASSQLDGSDRAGAAMTGSTCSCDTSRSPVAPRAFSRAVRDLTNPMAILDPLGLAALSLHIAFRAFL